MSGLTPKNPDFAARVRAIFEAHGAMRLIGAELVSIEPGAVDVAADFRPDLSQQDSYFHGGVVAMLADSAGGYAAFSMMPADAAILTVEYKINLLAPAHGSRLIAKGRVTRAGRTLCVCAVDVTVLRAGREHHCATMLQTLMALPGRSDGPAARRPG